MSLISVRRGRASNAMRSQAEPGTEGDCGLGYFGSQPRSHQHFRDLHGVCRRPLAEVVGDHPQVQPVRQSSDRGECGRRTPRRGPTQCKRQRHLALGIIIEHDDARRLRSASRACSGVIGLSNSRLIASECPMRTGTRTVVGDTWIVSSPMIFFVSLTILISSSL